jgi:hypothetical protein
MEMEGRMQQMLERLFARQTEKMKARQEKADAEVQARQDKADGKAEAAINSVRSDEERSLHQHMEALLEELRSCRKRTTICMLASEVCQDNSKAVLKEMEAAVNTLEERSRKMDATDLEANPEATEAAVVRPSLTSTISGQWRTDMEIDAWLNDVATGQRSESKTVLGPGRSRLPPASESYVAPSLQCARDVSVGGPKGSKLQEEPLTEEGSRSHGEGQSEEA